MTPPLLVRSIQGGFRPYAVRTGPVRNNSVKSYAALQKQSILFVFVNIAENITQLLKKRDWQMSEVKEVNGTIKNGLFL